jgi:hypothetical protein
MKGEKNDKYQHFPAGRSCHWIPVGFTGFISLEEL